MAKRSKQSKTPPARNDSNRSSNGRLAVTKTYKLFINGQFPRTESGRYFVVSVNGHPIANLCRASRKDLRNAVVAARGAFASWSARSPFNRSQILYRIGEMLESRMDSLVAELRSQGLTASRAQRETRLAVDRTIYYAGWCDKYQQVLASVNPVASSHFNFSVLEPMGVVCQFAPLDSPLLGLVSMVLPAIVGGNTVVAVASEQCPLSAVTWAEILATSDLPAGVVNILTGYRDELLPHAAGHMDINGMAMDRPTEEQRKAMEIAAADNVKRLRCYDLDWGQPTSQSPYLIQDFSEVKTTWHPIERIGPSGTAY